jgi:hypothetical protein
MRGRRPSAAAVGATMIDSAVAGAKMSGDDLLADVVGKIFCTPIAVPHFRGYIKAS